MTTLCHNVGAFVRGAPTSARALCRHADLLAAYAAGEIDDDGEAYLSHYSFGPEMTTHYRANRHSVAGFAGPCACRWLVLDIDRADLVEAMVDARWLVRYIGERYSELDDAVPIYFSGGKGFHILVELAHNPPPALGFHRVARTLAEAIAARAGVRIDAGIFDANHIVRLPNTMHPRTGLLKRRIDVEALFMLNIDGIRELAKRKDFTDLSAVGRLVPTLADDWREAERMTARATATRIARREVEADITDTRAPRYLMEFLRFGVDPGERHQTLFRCAAWLTEQGSPPSLVRALLIEPGQDVGLPPKDVERQIACGIEHARRQRGVTSRPLAENQGNACEQPLDGRGATGAATIDFSIATADPSPYLNEGSRS